MLFRSSRPDPAHPSQLVTFVTVLPNRYRRAEPQWPEGWWPPSSPVAAPRAAPAFLARLLRSNLYAVLDDSVPAPEVAAELDALAPRRSPEDVAAYQAQWDRTTAATRRQPKPKARPASNGLQHTPRTSLSWHDIVR